MLKNYVLAQFDTSPYFCHNIDQFLSNQLNKQKHLLTLIKNH